MKLVDTIIDRERFSGFERHEAIFAGRKGREFRFFFIVPDAFSGWLNGRADHWFVLGATSAAILKEDYSQDAPVPALLKRHIECLIRQWASWYPGAKAVALDVPCFDEHRASECGGAKRNGIFYTGGVDSTFTLTRHGDSADLLVKAVFDWDDEGGLVDQLKSSPRQIAGKDLLAVGTNVLRAFPEFADAWAYRTHGPALGALAHLFSRGVGHMIMSSSRTYGTLVPWGSHPLTDRLLSSEGLTFEHYGAEYSRIEKVIAIAENKELLNNLDVCGQAPDVRQGKTNCSNCNKCLRTMIAIDIAGARDLADQAFEWSFYTKERLARIRLHHPNEYEVYEEILSFSDKYKRYDISELIKFIIQKSKKYYFLGALESYLRRRFPSFISRNPIFLRAKRSFFKLREI